MKILFAYDPEQSGQDEDLFTALRTELSRCLSKTEQVEVLAWPVSADTPAPPDEFQGVILYNALPWYLKRRLLLKGRFSTLSCSFCFADLIPLLRMSIPAQDLGLSAVFTNCTEVIRQLAPTINGKFLHKPTYCRSEDGAVRTIHFGTVLHNVQDRDFSQLALTGKVLKELGETLVVFTPEKLDHPLPVFEGEIRGLKDVTDGYYDLQYFIPAIRITDIRGNIAYSSELREALLAGCLPLCLSHPVITKDLPVTPVFPSVTSYTDALARAAAGETVVQVTTDLASIPQVSPARFASEMAAAFRRIKTNATA